MKPVFIYLILPVSLLLIEVSTVTAEMVLCDGIWTNSSCEGISQKKVGATEAITEEQKALVKTRSKKRSLLHQITMSSIDARRQYGVDLSLDSAQETCREDSTTIEKCREVTEGFSEKLNVRIDQAVKIAQAKREEEEKSRPPVVAQQTTIIIEDRPNYITDYRRRRHPRRRDYRGHGSGHSSHVGSGASINLRGQSSNGSYSIGVNTGGSSSEHSHSTHYTTSNGSVSQHKSAQRSPGGFATSSPVAKTSNGRSLSASRSN